MTKGWKSHYWRSWLDGLDLYDESDGGFEVAFAVDDDDDIADDQFIGEIIEVYVDNGVTGKESFDVDV